MNPNRNINGLVESGCLDIIQLTRVQNISILVFCCDKYLSLDENVKDASNKIKGTLLNLINCGIYEGGFNHITSHHLYTTVVLPKAIYGCELWNNLLPKHISLHA